MSTSSRPKWACPALVAGRSFQHPRLGTVEITGTTRKGIDIWVRAEWPVATDQALVGIHLHGYESTAVNVRRFLEAAAELYEETA